MKVGLSLKYRFSIKVYSGIIRSYKRLVEVDSVYYYFAEYSKDLLDIKREATQEEYEKLESSLKLVSQMYADRNRIDNINISYKDLMEAIWKLATHNQYEIAKEIQYKLSLFLFEFKKFLDNWETDLTRKYGKDSVEFKSFKAAQGEQFDKHMEYRIMYRLRNYDQHCGNIISNITVSLDENENEVYRILANRDTLLNSFKEWKEPEIDYLKNQDEHIDLFPYMKQLNICILKIYEKAMQMHFNRELLIACAEIINTANEFENEDVVRIISSEKEIDEVFWKQPMKTFNFTHLMVPVCKQILSFHIRDNLKVVKVLYQGKNFDKRLRECAVVVDSKIVPKIVNSQFVDLAGQKMIRLLLRLFLDDNEMYVVLVDARYEKSKLKELTSDYDLFLKALTKMK